MMKTFNINDYPSQCPLAKATEDAVNNCNTAIKNLEKIEAIFGYDDRIYSFFCACIQYWATARYYDERNKYTVLICKEIVNKFPKIPHLKGVEICQELQKEAFAFTSFAHRYLQNELFKTILEYFKKSGHDGLYEWFKQQEFVIDPILDKAVPWTEYKKTH